MFILSKNQFFLFYRLGLISAIRKFEFLSNSVLFYSYIIGLTIILVENVWIERSFFQNNLVNAKHKLIRIKKNQLKIHRYNKMV